MRTGAINFKFDVSDVVINALRSPSALQGATAFELPFVTILANPSAFERKIANDLLISLGDRRVLSSSECCDNCIDQALQSLQEIRSLLLECRLKLAEEQCGILCRLMELMLTSIRQFLTFEQSLEIARIGELDSSSEFYRLPEERQIYFDALEQLRGHLSRCMGQISVVADLNLPSDGFVAGYQGPWQMEAYLPIAAPTNRLSRF